MPLILLIESSTDICSVGVSDSNGLLSYCEAGAAYDHAARITLLIAEAMEKAGFGLPDLDAVAVSIGPGSFTALRVGASTAKGICFALKKHLIAVDTLAALAGAEIRAQAGMKAVYAPMIDARRMEVYTAFYRETGEELKPPHALVVTSEVLYEYLLPGEKIVLCGNGAAKCKAVLDQPGIVFGETVCTAGMLAGPALADFTAGRFADLAYLEPFYLKPPNITIPKSRL